MNKLERTIQVLAMAMAVLIMTAMHVQAAPSNAAQFTSASNSYIAAASSTELKTFSALTLEAWIKPNGGGEWATIMGKQYNGDNANPWWSYRLYVASANPSEQGFPRQVAFNIAPVSAGVEVGVASTTVVQNDIWTHVAGVYDGATMKIYINGTPEGTVDQTGDLKASDLPMYIGKAPWTNYNNYNGQMDELRVWNVARTEEQIQYAMNRSLAGNEEGLVAYWPFNDAAGSPTADDASQYNHVGTLYDGAAIVADSTVPVVAVCVQPPSGMVSWWGGDNNALDMFGGNNGILMADATYAPGKVGQAFSFDGTANSYVEIAHNPSLDSTDAFTIDGWFYIDPNALGNNGGEASLVAKTSGGVGDGGWFLWFQDSAAYTNALRFDILTWGSPAWPYAEVNNIIMSAGWYHIAGVFDLASNPQAKLYVNGVLVASSTSTISAILNNTLPVRIGASHWGDGALFNGMADEVEFFNVALTADQIAAIYYAGSAGKCRSCTSPPSNLLSWWPFEEGSGVTTADITGINNGTINGATRVTGKAGGALSFDGVDDYVVIPNGIIPSTARNFTVDAWAYPSVLDNSSRMIVYGGSTAGEYEFLVNDTNDYGFSVKLSSGWYKITTPATVQAWAHVVGIRRGLNIELWVDGVLRSSVAVPDEDLVATGSNSNNSRIGAYNEFTTQHKSFWKGLIDEVQILDRALSADEIAAIYNAGGAGECSYAIGTNSPSNGTIVCNTLAAAGYNSACTITSNTGYYLSALSDNTTNVLSSVAGTPPNLTYTMPGVTELHTLEATFSESWIKRVSSLNYYYNLLSEAFGAVADNDTVMLRQGSFTGSAYDRDGVSITLKGGYNTGFGLNTDQHSTISDLLTISRGTVTVENVTIQ